MSVLICEGCGELTNTAICNYIETEDLVPTKCYARILEGTRAWTKGCGYNDCDPFMQSMADSLINGVDKAGPNPNRC